METVVEVTDLRKRYGSTVAVDGLSFAIGRGEVFGIVGPNGAGKTTAVECIEGLRHPDGGVVRVLGRDPRREGGELRQRIGVQLQQAALPNRIRVWEALDLFASYYRRPVDWRPLLDEWGLAEKRDATFASLSGGQRQRLFIALALVNDPEIVFLDELTTGLDPQARHTTWDHVRAIRDRGVTVVLVTHFMEEAERLCDRVAVIDAGRLVALDAPSALVAGLAAERQVRFHRPAGFEPSWLDGLPAVHAVATDGGDVVVTGTDAVLAEVATALARRDVVPAGLRAGAGSLEDVFLSLTGRALRD